ncbi:MAG: LuxR C-terminal-related transcriptional regulator [Rhodoferax sp.]|nr:LuxR C-terminal-related transcriptional regulator [Rhodoferax sp.]
MRAGASPISPMIARRVLSKYRLSQEEKVAAQPRHPVLAAAIYPHLAHDAFATQLLSPREQEVLTLIARGFSHTEIAKMLTLWYLSLALTFLVCLPAFFSQLRRQPTHEYKLVAATIFVNTLVGLRDWYVFRLRMRKPPMYRL